MCQVTWPDHFQTSEMELSCVRNFPQGLSKALIPQASEEGMRHSQGTYNFLHNMHPSSHRAHFSSFSQFTPKIPVRRAGGLTEARYENYLPACHLS